MEENITHAKGRKEMVEKADGMGEKEQKHVIAGRGRRRSTHTQATMIFIQAEKWHKIAMNVNHGNG